MIWIPTGIHQSCIGHVFGGILLSKFIGQSVDGKGAVLVVDFVRFCKGRNSNHLRLLRDMVENANKLGLGGFGSKKGRRVDGNMFQKRFCFRTWEPLE